MTDRKETAAEFLRRLAFDELYILPGVQERGDSTIEIEVELIWVPATERSVFISATVALCTLSV
jgi:hypothetical protein